MGVTIWFFFLIFVEILASKHLLSLHSSCILSSQVYGLSQVTGNYLVKSEITSEVT